MSHNQKTQYENVTELPQTTTLPLKDLWRNYAWCIGIGTVIGWFTLAVGVWTDWYYLLVVGFVDLCLRNWWLAPTLILIIGLFSYWNLPKRWRRKGGEKKRKDKN